jgi:diguanylate cyclase (GGDEF)-like protein
MNALADKAAIANLGVEELALLLELGEHLVSELDMDNVLALVTETARQVVRAETMVMPMIEPDGQTFTYRAASGEYAAMILHQTFPIHEGACGWVMQNQRPLLFGEDGSFDLDASARWQPGMASNLLVPLICRGTITGGLSAMGKQGGAAFNLRDLTVLTLFANQASIAIDNARLFQELGVKEAHLRQVNANLEQRVAERTSELEEANQKLVTLSITDGLTGLVNRRRFDEVLASEYARSRRTGQPLALVMLDVDYFKKYNDRYGHQAGDDCLKAVANQLKAQAARRACDLVARYGGEEFTIILADTDLSTAQGIAERVRQAIEATEVPHEMSSFGKVTVSVGLAVMASDCNMDAEGLLHAADLALYQAKHEGRNRVGLAT